MTRLEGVITLVQESRFILRTDQGASHLIIVSHAARLEPEQLVLLQRDQSRVRVKCDQAPGLIAFVAQSVTLLSREPANIPT
jgi:hypothetical protein